MPYANQEEAVRASFYWVWTERFQLWVHMMSRQEEDMQILSWEILKAPSRRRQNLPCILILLHSVLLFNTCILFFFFKVIWSRPTPVLPFLYNQGCSVTSVLQNRHFCTHSNQETLCQSPSVCACVCVWEKAWLLMIADTRSNSALSQQLLHQTQLTEKLGTALNSEKH